MMSEKEGPTNHYTDTNWYYKLERSSEMKFVRKLFVITLDNNTNVNKLKHTNVWWYYELYYLLLDE